MFGAVDQSVHSTTPVMFQPVKKTPHASGVFKTNQEHHVASCCMLFDIVNMGCTWANDSKKYLSEILRF